MRGRYRELYPVERMVFFTDAVVAIAMTLLILPLLESVTEAAAAGLSTREYVIEHDGQLVAFALSFVVISVFWRGHDRLYAPVAHFNKPLFWLNVAWMFSIVWLPVATAMVGAMETDPLQLTLYIGTMFTTSLITVGTHLLLWRSPQLRTPGDVFDVSALRGVSVATGLFGLALGLALTVPGLQFWSLLVLTLNGPVEWALSRSSRWKR